MTKQIIVMKIPCKLRIVSHSSERIKNYLIGLSKVFSCLKPFTIQLLIHLAHFHNQALFV